MEYPKVLAVVPAYNSAAYVEKAVISLLRQDYAALRIILIDDCSSDNIFEVIGKYRDRIEVIRNEQNSGFSYSLNRALSMAEDREFLIVLQDDMELTDVDYVTRGLKHFDDSRVALVCGQAIDFSPQRLSLIKRFFARYVNYDYQEDGVTEVSYSVLKADLIRVASLRQVGGFGFAGNPKSGAEDHILAKKLRDRGFILLKDASLKYSFDYARVETLIGLLRSESNIGKTLGVGVSQGVISINPTIGAETRSKSNYRRIQVITVALVCMSFLLFAYSWRLALAVIAGILALEFVNYLRKSNGFRGWEKLYFAAIGLINDFVFSFSFYWGVILGLKAKCWAQSKSA